MEAHRPRHLTRWLPGKGNKTHAQTIIPTRSRQMVRAACVHEEIAHGLFSKHLPLQPEPQGQIGLYVPQGPCRQRGPVLAGDPDHLRGAGPLPFHGQAGPGGSISCGAGHKGATLAGKRKSQLQSVPAGISIKQNGPPPRGGFTLAVDRG